MMFKFYNYAIFGMPINVLLRHIKSIEWSDIEFLEIGDRYNTEYQFTINGLNFHKETDNWMFSIGGEESDDDSIIVKGMFEGSRRQFRDCFFSNADNDTIFNWGDSQGYEIVIKMLAENE